MSTPVGPSGGNPSPDNLAIPEIINRQGTALIREVLSADSWRWLTRTVCAAWEKDLSRQRVRVDLTALNDSETAAMADFLGWPTHKTGAATISLSRLDAMLRASGLSAGFATCLTAAGGPLRDEAARRRADKAAREAAISCGPRPPPILPSLAIQH